MTWQLMECQQNYGQIIPLTDVPLRQTNPLTGSLTVSSFQDYVA
jgi:hypothetical protein